MPEPTQPVYTSADTPSKARLVYGFFVPSRAEFLTYLIVAFVVLCLFNIWGIIGLITGDASITGTQVSTALQSYRDQISMALDRPFLATASSFIVWGIIGCIAYMLAWLGKGYFTRLYEDVEGSHNVQPITTPKGSYWQSVIGHNIFFGCTVFVALIYTVLSMSVFIPACLALFGHSLDSWFQWQSLVGCATSTLGLVVIFQVARILVRLLHNSWKLFFADTE